MVVHSDENLWWCQGKRCLRCSLAVADYLWKASCYFLEIKCQKRCDNKCVIYKYIILNHWQEIQGYTCGKFLPTQAVQIWSSTRHNLTTILQHLLKLGAWKKILFTKLKISVWVMAPLFIFSSYWNSHCASGGCRWLGDHVFRNCQHFSIF